MSKPFKLISQIQQWLKQAIAHPGLRRFILIGYAAKGILYFLIGILTTQAALLPAQDAAGSYSALSYLVKQPLGRFMLVFFAVGLLGYVLRRFLQAVIDPGYSQPLNPKRILHRLGYGMSSLSYAGVAGSAINIAVGRGENDDMVEDLAGQLFDLPLGEWVLFFGGLAVASVGLSYLYGAYTGSYLCEFRSCDVHHRVERWAIRIGKVGVAARGIAFVLISIFLIQAAFLAEAEIAGGLQYSFSILKAQPWGSLWLGIVGIGFIAYGVYMFIAAKYRRYPVR